MPLVFEPESAAFLGLPQAGLAEAQIALLPVPYEGAISYGSGTSHGPAAIWEASTQIELWDYELGIDLESIRFHSAEPVTPLDREPQRDFTARIYQEACILHEASALVIGVGGDHSVTPPLLHAAIDAGNTDAESTTVVHVDAHADLRDSYEGNRGSHACAMARALDLGVRVLSIGIRSTERAEHQRAMSDERITTFSASELATDQSAIDRLHQSIGSLQGPVYLSFDIDALDTHLCPATGTPEPGGLGWWFTLDLLGKLIRFNRSVRLIGADVVETTPQAGTTVNEYVAAKLIAKIAALQTISAPA